MKRNVVLVTGGGGYVGSELVRALIKKSLVVRVFDKFFFGNTLDQSKDIEIIHGDIRNAPKHLFSNIHSVIHLAALSNDPTANYNPSANYSINTVATIQLAQQAKDNGVKRFIFASSCSIYDSADDGSNIKDEESYVAPKMPYSLSKYKAENELLTLADKDFCVFILRMGTIFGSSHRMRYDLVVNSMVKDAISKGVIKIFSGGLQRRPLVGITDVVKAYSLALSIPIPKLNKQIVNISLDNFLIRDIATIVQKTLKKNFKINTSIIFEKKSLKDRSYSVTNIKSSKLLKFRATATIEKAVVDMVKNIKSGIASDFDNKIYYNIEWLRPFLES